MFYLKEILIRFKYIFYSIALCLIVSIYYYPILFNFLHILFNSLKSNFNENNLNYYIYTHPFELYYTQLVFCIYLSFFLIIPLILWQVLDFLKSGLYFKEYKKLFTFFTTTLIIFVGSYIFLYSYLLPNIAIFFSNIETSYISNIINIFFEVKVQDFIKFIIYVHILYSFLIFLLIFFSKIIFNLSIKITLHYKKIFYLIIFFMGTILTPPDVYSQICLIFILFILMEVTIFLRFCLYYFYLNYGNALKDNK